MNKNCSFCNGSFEHNYPHAKFCSSDCRSQWYIEARKQRYAETKAQKIPRFKNCEGCDQQFLIEGSRTRFCDEMCARYSDVAKFETEDRRLKDRYGITLIEYNQMYADQCGLCAICSGDLDASSRKAPVDHDHSTGKVRGLLCHFCNRGLGLFKDDPELLESAAMYIRERSK